MMASEAATLLALITSLDRFRTSVAAVEAISWGEALHDITFANGRAAVIAHYRTKQDSITIADIVAGVKRVRAEALRRHGDPLPEVDPDDAPAYRAELYRRRLQIMDAAGTDVLEINA